MFASQQDAPVWQEKRLPSRHREARDGWTKWRVAALANGASAAQELRRESSN
ncbi:MAG: hypothetical protein ABI697_02480 [Devosia sp.]